MGCVQTKSQSSIKRVRDDTNTNLSQEFQSKIHKQQKKSNFYKMQKEHQQKEKICINLQQDNETCVSSGQNTTNSTPKGNQDGVQSSIQQTENTPCSKIILINSNEICQENSRANSFSELYIQQMLQQTHVPRYIVTENYINTRKQVKIQRRYKENPAPFISQEFQDSSLLVRRQMVYDQIAQQQQKYQLQIAN